jgi:hypothetical protein
MKNIKILTKVFAWAGIAAGLYFFVTAFTSLCRYQYSPNMFQVFSSYSRMGLYVSVLAPFIMGILFFAAGFGLLSLRWWAGVLYITGSFFLTLFSLNSALFFGFVPGCKLFWGVFFPLVVLLFFYRTDVIEMFCKHEAARENIKRLRYSWLVSFFVIIAVYAGGWAYLCNWFEVENKSLFHKPVVINFDTRSPDYFKKHVYVERRFFMTKAYLPGSMKLVSFGSEKSRRFVFFANSKIGSSVLISEKMLFSYPGWYGRFYGIGSNYDFFKRYWREQIGLIPLMLKARDGGIFDEVSGKGFTGLVNQKRKGNKVITTYYLWKKDLSRSVEISVVADKNNFSQILLNDIIGGFEFV